MAGKKGWNTAWALLLAGILLGGCVMREGPSVRPSPSPEPLTAASLLGAVNENLLARGGAATRIRGSMVYTLGDREGERELSARLDLSGESRADALGFHAQGSADMALGDIAAQVPVEIYALEESGGTIYVRVLDEWMKKTLAGGGGEAASLLGSAALQQAARLSEDTETVEGRRCYRLDIPVTAAMLSRAGGLTLGAGTSGPALDATLWVEEETRLPLRLELSLTAPLLSPGLAIREMEIQVDYLSFGPAGDLTPPPEALRAGEMGE